MAQFEGTSLEVSLFLKKKYLELEQNQTQLLKLHKKVGIAVDMSGSTGTLFTPGMNVLEKELEIVSLLSIEHPEWESVYCYFDHNVTPLKSILVDEYEKEKYVHLDPIQPGGSTMTHLGLKELLKCKLDMIILVTDGQTNSSRQILQEVVQNIKENGIEFNIIAVCPNDLDYAILEVEESKIPGMDIIEYVGNNVDNLSIYNKKYQDTPFNGAKSSQINKNNLTFMGIEIKSNLHEFISNLMKIFELNSEESEPIQITWGRNNINFNKFLTEIGILLTAWFSTFPDNDSRFISYINNICDTICKTCQIDGITQEYVFGRINYGFRCSRNNVPIYYTNIDEHVKTADVKYAQFADANELLKNHGTTLGCENTIGFSLDYPLIVLNNGNSLRLNKSFDKYRNSACDLGNIVFFSYEEDKSQAIRQSLRTLAGKKNFPNALKSPSVIFMIPNIILQMIISGYTFDSEYIKILQKLAKIQTSMDSVIGEESNGKPKYGGPFFNHWKRGNLPRMYFKNPNTHTTLFKERQINPFNLTEPLWWASMMLVLGLFNEQLSIYNNALKAENIDLTEEAFLNYLKDNYLSQLTENYKTISLRENQKSYFTLDNFPSNESCYILDDHGPENQRCKTQSIFSASEIDYVIQRGCIWCRRSVNRELFKQINLDPSNLIRDVIDEIKLERDNMISSSNSNSSSSYSSSTSSRSSSSPSSSSSSNLLSHSISNLSSSLSSLSIITSPRKILIALYGITGAGKTTTSSKMNELVNARGGLCHILSSDYYDKQDIDKTVKNRLIKQDIRNFESSSNPLKVLIVDLCNDKGLNKSNLFGHDFSNYESFDFFPNLDRTNFDDYESWCLNNVLNRSCYSRDTLYFLNPENAGKDTCVNVHNMKASGIKKIIGLNTPTKNFSKSLSMQALKDRLKESVDRYSNYLRTRSLDSEIQELFNIINL